MTSEERKRPGAVDPPADATAASATPAPPPSRAGPVGRAERPGAAAKDDPIVVHLRDAASGTMDVFVGTPHRGTRPRPGGWLRPLAGADPTSFLHRSGAGSAAGPKIPFAKVVRYVPTAKHRIAKDPVADFRLYAVSPDHSTRHADRQLRAVAAPLPRTELRVRDDVRYEIHIDNDGDGRPT
jgi:hypothetical protein